MRMAFRPILIPGEIYRDLDGTLVQLINVDNDLCCWIPLTQPWAAREITHRDNFAVRFHPLASSFLEAA